MSGSTLGSKIAKHSAEFGYMFSKLYFCASSLREGGWRPLQWLLFGHEIMVNVYYYNTESKIVKFPLGLMKDRAQNKSVYPLIILSPYVLKFPVSFFPIWKTTIKTLPVIEICSWKSLNIGLILPITSCCQGNDLRREAAPLHMLSTCFAGKDSQLLVVHLSAILSHLPPSCLTKGNISKERTGGKKCRQGKQKG